MLKTRELFDSLTAKPTLSSDNLAAAVDALQDCVEAVTACSAAMLTEDDLQSLASAVSRDMDCADVVTATRNVLTRASGVDTSLLSAQLEACLVACERSHDLCSKHAERHKHCRMCADATRHCADMCRQALNSLHR
ncbi:four-helix bundle copper-binding protein [Saccharopolyspora shandongensis]|uniref:four-helix bundle copper-binding protein n=1 Tax=Saccharopolyspora shandongensis TaxID=418495 RepID=UPI0034461363